MKRKIASFFIIVMVGLFCPVPAPAAFDVFQVAGSYYPEIAYDSYNNRYLAVYVKYDAVDTADSDIYGQLIAPDGSAAGAPFVISDSVDLVNDKTLPAVAYDSANKKFLVVWQDDRNDPGSTFDVYGQLVNADGTMDGGNFPISAVAGRHEWYPSLAYDSTNERFLVLWEDERDTEGFPLIYGQLVNANGASLGALSGLTRLCPRDRWYSPPQDSLLTRSTVNFWSCGVMTATQSATRFTDNWSTPMARSMVTLC